MSIFLDFAKCCTFCYYSTIDGTPEHIVRCTLKKNIEVPPCMVCDEYEIIPYDQAFSIYSTFNKKLSLLKIPE
jgi:hypothetical protein